MASFSLFNGKYSVNSVYAFNFFMNKMMNDMMNSMQSNNVIRKVYNIQIISYY